MQVPAHNCTQGTKLASHTHHQITFQVTLLDTYVEFTAEYSTAGFYPVTWLRALFRLLFNFHFGPSSSWTLVRLDVCHPCLTRDLF